MSLGATCLGWLQKTSSAPTLCQGLGGQLAVDAGAHHHQRAEGRQGGRPVHVREGQILVHLDLTFIYLQSNLNEKFRNQSFPCFSFVNCTQLKHSVRLSWAVNNLNERRCQWQSQWRTMPIADNINCLWEKTSMEETLNWRCSQKTTSIQKANIASIQLTILQNHQSQEPNSTETELGKSPSSLSSYHLFYQLDKFQKRLK